MGRIDTQLMINSGGKISEQYKIEMVKMKEGGEWKQSTKRLGRCQS
jgi:hypothetical protein